MGLINEVRKFRASAAGCGRWLTWFGHVVLFSRKMSFAYHAGDKVAIEVVRRNNVFEVDMEDESVNQCWVCARQAQP